MLTNFLEHTRCPEDIVSSILSQSQSATERGDTPTAGNANGIAGNRPAFDPLKLLRTLQSPVEGPGQLYSRLSEFDNAISILRMEKYVDNSTSGENHKLLKFLVRRCY